ncbi:MAG: ATP-binding protein [Chloroflexota bacterium]
MATGLDSGVFALRPSRPRGRPLLVALATLVVLLPLWGWATTAHRSSLLIEQRNHVAHHLAPYANALFMQLTEHFGILRGLSSSLVLEPTDDRTAREWQASAAAVLSTTPGARGLAVAPRGVLTRAYPAPPAGLALGENLLAEGGSVLRAAAAQAVRSRDTTLSNTYDERTGEMQLVAWRAVYEGEEFLSLVAMELQPEHFRQALLLNQSGQALDIAWRDSRGSLIYGEAAVFAAEPALHQLELREGIWQIGAVPVGGWEAAIAGPVLTFGLYGLAFVTLLVFIAYLLASRDATLVATVRARTAEVSRVNQELRADVARRVAAEEERERLLERLGRQVDERTHHLAALYDVTAVASSSLDLNTILEQSLDRILAVMGCDVAAVHLDYLVEQRPTRVATVRTTIEGALVQPCSLANVELPRCYQLASQQPLRVADTATDPRTRDAFQTLGARAHLGVPVRGREGALGVLCLFRSPDRPFTDEEATLLAAISDRLGVAVENARLFAQASGKAVLEERQRLARELHDSVTQLLYGAVLIAEATRRVAGTGEVQRVQDYVERLGTSVQQALKEMRLLVYELRPLSLEQDGLAGALQRRLDAVEKRAGLRTSLVVEALPPLAPAVEEALYRIAQEALNNTLKHAGASEVAVELRSSADGVHLRVADTGSGLPLDRSADKGGLGLANMRERAERLGGSFTIRSDSDEGTVVEVRLPHAAALAGSGAVLELDFAEVTR